ncbi:asparagine synthase-related protein [Undibacterium sp. Ren11W]|uniref:asparagine synthase-related protein n=1 Tax=Undibacterium sp. Ren11W TaxID=3413045 RepID=UPI003BF42579
MLFLGVYDPSSSQFEPSEIEELKHAISRQSDDKRHLVLAENFALITIDFGPTGGALVIENDLGHVGMVVGRPYLNMDNAGTDANILIKALKNRDVEALTLVRGSFCGICFDKRSKSLMLCTDKVGVFPIYIAKVGNRIYFSNALRMLRSITKIPKKIVPEHMFSQLAFGYCLARDTIFAGIDRMYGGELIEIAASTMHINSYWRWDDIKPSHYSENELQERIYQAFIDAVKIRVEPTPAELSFLSGGLDSRCIVAALRNIDRPVWTLNFAPDGSQDHLFGRLAATALGSHHYELGLGRDSFSKRQRKILDSWASAHPELVKRGVKAHRVWSGDGGSVGMGHVYLDHAFIQLLREKKIQAASEYLMKHRKLGIPLGMLRSDVKHEAESRPLEKMTREMQSFTPEDDGKSGLLFFLMNDQRHHLSNYFEDLDLYQFEVVLPFFDSVLLELIVAAPIDDFLLHTFYNKWLAKFGPAISTVPWQAYPNHVPCPIYSEEYGKLRYQWNEDWFDKAENDRKLQEKLGEWRRMLARNGFPKQILAKNKLWLAYWLTRLKIRDYTYILDAAKEIIFFNDDTH